MTSWEEGGGGSDVAYLTPYRRYHKVASVVAIINQPVPVTMIVLVSVGRTHAHTMGRWLI
jgi:hypothetical protein